MPEVGDIARKYALLNASQHNGKANVKAVLGKVISEGPEFKSKVKEISSVIEAVVNEVNGMTPAKREAELSMYKIEEKEKKDEGLPALPDAVNGKVVMRMAPYPSGPLHIGNARMAILNDEYVKRYGGRLILVFDDTIGSKEKFVIEEGYEMIREGLEWLGVEYNEVQYKSDRMQLFYDYSERMLKEGLAYVCLCTSAELRDKRIKGRECKHRKQDVETNLKLWNKMLGGELKQGEASVRLKTDMKDPNPAFRDRVLLRIANREHPRVGKKYRVWPMLEFSWAVDDYELGMTHILRGKDLAMEDQMQLFIWDRMGIPKKSIPHFLHYGMLKLKEAKLSKSKARAAIESGAMSGWEDPRTWSLQSLKKRGISPGAVRKFIIHMGMSMSDVTVPAEILYSENRRIIDKEADRYFAVFDPMKISVKGIGRKKIESAKAPRHPEFAERGERTIPVDVDEIYIEKSDYKKFKGKELAMMNLFTVKLGKESEYITDKISMESPKAHWVSKEYVKAAVVMPNGRRKNVLIEPEIRNAKEGDIVQLVRTGFCRVDKAGEGITLYFAHK